MSSCSRTRTKAPRSARGHRNRGFSSSSAKIVADLDDVLIQILSLLSIKTLIRFKCVSKRWLSLITNPDFSNCVINSKHHPMTISGFFLHSSRAIKYSFVSLDDHDDAINQKISSPLPFRFTDHPTDMIIMQSTNGLLLCRCSCAAASSNQFNTNYYVYNPTTKQYTLLPQITGDISLSLAFDPCKSPHYKVFCLRGRRRNISFPFHIEIEVYTSNEGPWKKLVSFPSSPSPFIEFNATVFWNGAVHWFAPNTRDCLSFDINQEEIKILSLPNLDDEDEALVYPSTLRFLDESRGNLYFIEVNDQSSSNVSVYEMERNSSSWSVKYNVDLEPLAAAFPEMIRTIDYNNTRIYEFSIIGFVKQETDAETYIVLQIANKAVKYNFIDKTFKKLCDFNNDAPEDEFYRFQKTFQFIESLANV
ncbi:F-box protein [Cardamine amara subsp. amara]|uniref:F-box protein n=1 Tax=Cardamine amara subsp. amara TaxID=228776 RepID=A0ABD0ZZE8_CARAN